MESNDKWSWLGGFDEREQAQVNHAIEYAWHFSQSGVPGHSQFMLIAKLANAVASREQELLQLQQKAQ